MHALHPSSTTAECIRFESYCQERAIAETMTNEREGERESVCLGRRITDNRHIYECSLNENSQQWNSRKKNIPNA